MENLPIWVMCSMEFIPERSCWSARYTCTVHNCIILLTCKSFCFIVSCRDAFHYVQQRRFCINPNEGFVQQLMVSDEFVGCAHITQVIFMRHKGSQCWYCLIFLLCMLFIRDSICRNTLNTYYVLKFMACRNMNQFI